MTRYIDVGGIPTTVYRGSDGRAAAFPADRLAEFEADPVDLLGWRDYPGCPVTVEHSASGAYVVVSQRHEPQKVQALALAVTPDLAKQNAKLARYPRFAMTPMS